MSPQKLIVVFAVTGNQGASVARHLTSKGWRVRGLTRDPSPRPATRPLLDMGVELTTADLDAPASLDAALAGAAAVYANTDFWSLYAETATKTQADAAGVTVNEMAMRREMAQGRRVAEAAARLLAQKESPLERFVYSTLSDTRRWTDGAVTENWHFDGKAAVEAYVRAELPALAAVTNYLMLGFYMANWAVPGFPFSKQNDDGCYVFTALKQEDGSAPAKVPHVHPPADTGAYVDALLAAPAGVVLVGHSERMTLVDFAAAWAKASGRPARVAYVSTDEMLARDQSPFGREIAANFLYTTKWRYEGYAPELRDPVDLGMDVKSLMTVDQYLAGVDWSILD